MIFYQDCYDDEVPLTWCELCGHPHAHRHRIKPGIWGGRYVHENVVQLCPNHHAAIHFLMAWYLGSVRKSRHTRDDGRLMVCMNDRPLWEFWNQDVKPVVTERLRDEGRLHPYVRKEGLVTVRRRRNPDLV